MLALIFPYTLSLSSDTLLPILPQHAIFTYNPVNYCRSFNKGKLAYL